MSTIRLTTLGACASALLLGACAQLLGIDDLSGPGADAGVDPGADSGVDASPSPFDSVVFAKASNAEQQDEFGYAIAMSGDTLVVGAPFEDSALTGVSGTPPDDDELPASGAAYVFRRTGDTWMQEAYLKASDTAAGDHFGQSVAISGDVIAIGAPDRDEADALGDAGAVYLFRRTGGTWAVEARITASNIDAGDGFGHAVALDGDTLAVGARREDGSATGDQGNFSDTEDSGAVYVFRKDATGWQQEAYLKASNAGLQDQFGRSVALDGNTLAVGARFEDSSGSGVDGQPNNDDGVNSGAVYVFRKDVEGWVQEAYIKAPNSGFHDHFGLSLALDQDTLAVGAPFEDSGSPGVDGNPASESARNSGAVYVFRRTDGIWDEDAYIKASNPSDSEEPANSPPGVDANLIGGDNFGWNLALAGDVLVAGSIGEASASGNQNDDTAENSGAVYLFRHEGNGWSQKSYLKAPSIGAGDHFGYGVAFDGYTLAVSAHAEDSSATGVGGRQDDDATDSGALYLFY